MIDTMLFGNELKKLGFNFYSGVPCSILKDLINFAINNCQYISSVNEGDAVAIAAGAFIGGKKPVVLMQNSGLTNAVSPLVSLNFPFKIPILGFVSLRGEAGTNDQPQHELIGQITTEMLRLMKIEYEYLSCDFDKAKKQLNRANKVIQKNQSFFFVVKKGTFKEEELCQQNQLSSINILKKYKIKNDQLPSRYEALQIINSLKDRDTIQIATTGKTGRELYEIEDVDNNFYMVGSMGCVSSFGFGIALAKTNKDIVIIDGDGSLLMRMGSMATYGYYNPSNMLHILLDNNTYDSTGGQNTVSSNINFVGIAASCGYINSIYIHNVEELKDYINIWKKEKKLTFLYLKISKGSKKNLGRPKIKPYDVKQRLKVFINK